MSLAFTYLCYHFSTLYNLSLVWAFSFYLWWWVTLYLFYLNIWEKSWQNPRAGIPYAATVLLIILLSILVCMCLCIQEFMDNLITNQPELEKYRQLYKDFLLLLGGHISDADCYNAYTLVNPPENGFVSIFQVTAILQQQPTSGN